MNVDSNALAAAFKVATLGLAARSGVYFGVYFEPAAGVLRLATTDGCALITTDIPAPGCTPGRGFTATPAVLKTTLTGPTTDVAWAHGNLRINGELVHPHDNEFPDYRGIEMPAKIARVTILRTAFLAAEREARSLTGTHPFAARQLRLAAVTGGVGVFAREYLPHGQGMSNAWELIKILPSGEGVAPAKPTYFHATRLRDAFRAVGGKTVTLHFGGPLHPVLCTGEGATRVILMPMGGV